MSKCQFPKCRQPAVITYLGKELCERHWALIDKQPKRLRKALGLPEPKEQENDQG